MGLFDLVLIKDNHLAALKDELPSAIAVVVERARSSFPELKVEVEADTLEQVEQAVAAGADMVLLDNMTLIQLHLAVQKCKGRALTEASGGVTLGTARPIAEAGVDFISVGALTHSARAVDIALDFKTAIDSNVARYFNACTLTRKFSAPCEKRATDRFPARSFPRNSA